MSRAVLLAFIAAAVFAAKADAEQTGLVCMAPTLPAEAGKPFSDIAEIEFYVDGGNPLTAYTAPFVMRSSTTDAQGHTVLTYTIAGIESVAAEIVFAGETPLTFAIPDVGKQLGTLAPAARETSGMADAVPGIACWRVAVLGDLP